MRVDTRSSASRHTDRDSSSPAATWCVVPPPARPWILQNWFQTKRDSTWFNNVSAPLPTRNATACELLITGVVSSWSPTKVPGFWEKRCFIRLRIHPPPVPREAFLDRSPWEHRNGQCYGNLPVYPSIVLRYKGAPLPREVTTRLCTF